MRIKELLEWSRTRVSGGGGAERDMEILLGFVVGVNSQSLIGREHERLSTEAELRFRELVNLREEGCPIAYLTQNRSFWSLELFVNESVLIPRHETETLVECALESMHDQKSPEVCELGTGSGAVALSLAAEIPGARILATDLSREALDVAAVNARRQGIGNVRFLESDWYGGLQSSVFHLICSNPPYIASADPHLDIGDVRFEPRCALVSGSDGLDALREVICRAPSHLRQAGWLVVEHGYDQGMQVRDLFVLAGFSCIDTVRDLGGHERVTRGRWPGAGVLATI